MAAHYEYSAPHDRKCERCGGMFIATLHDQRHAIYACRNCRKPRPFAPANPTGGHMARAWRINRRKVAR